MRRAFVSTGILVLLIVSSLAHVVAGSDITDPSSPWFLETVMRENGAVYDIAVGELYESSPGDEIVVLGNNEVLIHMGTSFERETVYQGDYTLQAVAVGDARPDIAGNEIVFGGNDNQLHVLYKEGGTWAHEVVHSGTEPVNGVSVGEFDPDHAGKEVAFAGDEGPLWITGYEAGGWKTVEITLETEQYTKMLVASGDIMPSEGDEIMVGSFSGKAFVVNRESNGTYNVSTVHNEGEFAIVGFGVGDMYPNHTGDDLFITSFNGRVVMANWNGSAWITELVFQRPDENPLYTFAIGDFDPRYPGNEGIAVGTTESAFVIRYDDGYWANERLDHPKLNQLYDAEVGDVDLAHGGNEVLIGGGFEELLELSYTVPDFEVVALRPTAKAVKGQPGRFPVKTVAIGNYAGYVTYSVNTTTIQGVRFEPTFTEVGMTTVMEVPTQNVPLGFHTIEVVATSPETGISRSTAVTLDVLDAGTPGFVVDAYPRDEKVMAGFPTSFLVDVRTIGNFTETVSLALSGQEGRPADFNPPSLVPDGSSVLTVSTYQSDPGGALDLLIEASSPSWESIAFVSLEIETSEDPDFTLVVAPMRIDVEPGASSEIILDIQPLNNFQDDVVLALEGVEPAGIDIGFETTVLEPPVGLTVPITVADGASPGRHVLEFSASSGEIVHRAAVMVNVDDYPERTFGVSVEPGSQIAFPGDTCTFEVAVTGEGTDAVTLSAEPAEAGPVAKLDNKVVSPGTMTYLRVSIPQDATPGSYDIKVSGTRDWKVSESITVTVDPSLAFELEVEPDEQLGSPGQDVIYAIWSSHTDLTPIEATGLPPGSYSVDTIPGALEERVSGSGRTLYRYANLSVQAELLDEGDHTFMVRAERDGNERVAFVDINITGPMALLAVTNLSTASALYAGDEAQITVLVENKGYKDAHQVLAELIVDGIVVDSVEITTIGANASVEVTFKWTGEEGNHTVSAVAFAPDARTLEHAGPVEVDLMPRNWQGPVIGLILIIIIVALVLSLSSKKKEEEKEEVPEERLEEE